MTLPEFNQTVDLHADGVYRFILKNIRDRDKAKDIIQDTYEKIWRKVDEVPFEKAKTYLFTSAYHTMIDYIRREKKILDIDEINPNHLFDSKEYSNTMEILDKAIDLLPAAQRSVLLLRDYEGYSYREIGEITMLSESQVKVYIFRARLFLKEYLQKADIAV